MVTRRKFIESAALIGGGAAAQLLLPAWARSGASNDISGMDVLSGRAFHLHAQRSRHVVDGRRSRAVTINGQVPAPLLRWREGDDVTLHLINELDEDTSIHWHGILLPPEMDGVPGLSFPGVKPGESFTYNFPLKQAGTYWYHSHSGLQEQLGHFGPIIIEPKGADPVDYDREYVIVLSDWTFENPDRLFAKLKKHSEGYNFQKRTLVEFFRDAGNSSLGSALSERAMWGGMRMSPRDLADVTGAAYTYLINGHSTQDNWNGVFMTGERVRLRIINASAMSIFNIRMPGLPMTVVAADGLNVQPVETDEFQIGVAETYDVVVQPAVSRPYAFVAESIDRSGQAVATFGPQPGMRAEAPALRPVPTLTMKDMGMDHGGHSGHGARDMDHSGHDMPGMDHAMPAEDHAAHQRHGVSHAGHEMHVPAKKASAGAGDEGMMMHHHTKGPGVANTAMMPVSRLDEPGIGLEDVSHRVLTYADLRSLEPNADTRLPERELQIHLTSNMHRYMWSFNGVKFSEVTESIRLDEGERVRFNLVNDTMMPHPIHLHGMFFELENGAGGHRPRKHTVIVKPGEKLAFDVSSEHVGDWAFHCHLLYHMHAGMMNVVSVIPNGDGAAAMPEESSDPGAGHHRMKHEGHESPPDASGHEGHGMMHHGEHGGHK